MKFPWTFVFAIIGFTSAFIFVSMTYADAQRGRISLIRDAEIEALIQDYTRPLMKVVGLKPGSVQILIVNDQSLNAFVSGRSMFIHTGLLLQSKTPGEVIGVIAHELGHIVGGHQIRQRERMDRAANIAKWSTLLGLGLGAAGAATKNSELVHAGAGVALGGGNVALRDLLAYQRDEEASADRAAVEMLRKSGQSGAGMMRTFKNLARQVSIQAGRIDPYMMSHPMPNERIASLSRLLRSSPYWKRKSPPALQLRHDMVRAKIAAYVGGSRYASALLKRNELAPKARLYGRAIVAYLYGSPRQALPLIKKASQQSPKNAYLHEMRGEILLRSGNGRAAAEAFRQAVKLDKYRAGFLRVELGHALLESGRPQDIKEAVVQLRKGVTKDPTAVAGYQYLARAYGELGRVNEALLASAEFALRSGNKPLAKDYARRAQKGFKRGSPRWLRAGDIISFQ